MEHENAGNPQPEKNPQPTHQPPPPAEPQAPDPGAAAQPQQPASADPAAPAHPHPFPAAQPLPAQQPQQPTPLSPQGPVVVSQDGVAQPQQSAEQSEQQPGREPAPAAAADPTTQPSTPETQPQQPVEPPRPAASGQPSPAPAPPATEPAAQAPAAPGPEQAAAPEQPSPQPAAPASEQSASEAEQKAAAAQQNAPQPRSDERITGAPLELRPEDTGQPETAALWATRGENDAPAPKQQQSPAESQRQEPPLKASAPAPATPRFGPHSRKIIQAIEQALRDKNCTQIDGYAPNQITLQYNGRHQLLEGLRFDSPKEYKEWLRSLVRSSSAVITWEQVERERKAVLELPGGERLAIFLPPISRPHPSFSLRKHTAIEWPSQELVNRGSFSQAMHDFIAAAVAAHVNILFVGPMGSGKTTAARAFLQSAAADDERIAIVEQVPELAVNKPLALRQQYLPTTEGFKLADVLDYDLYFGLDRLIVGETHMEGLSKMLETMILTEGSMSTYHAYSTEQAGERMKLALQLEHENLSEDTAASFIRQAVELVVVLQKWGDKRLCTQITEIDWRTSVDSSMLSGNDLFVWEDGRQMHVPRNSPDKRGRVREKFRKYGLELDEGAFVDPEQVRRFGAQ